MHSPGRTFEADLMAALPDEAARTAARRALDPWRGSTVYLPARSTRKADAARLLLKIGVRRADGVGLLAARFGISESQARRIWNLAQDSKKHAHFDGYS